MVVQEISALVDRYINEIEIEDASFEPVDGTDIDFPDGACLSLIIPVKMLKEYLSLKKEKKKKDVLPDGTEFSKETNLVEKLLYSNQHNQDLDIRNVLNYLKGDTIGRFQKLTYPSGLVRLSITEF